MPEHAGLAPWRGLHRALRPAGFHLVSGFLAILTALLPLAGASLRDPVWLTGVYDGGDYDDLLALGGDIDPPTDPTAALPASLVRRGRSPASCPAPPASPFYRSFLPRAPPLS